MSRNLLPINTTGGDAKSSYTKRARLSFIMFAQPIHKDIHNLVVDAFAGEIVPVVPPWNLPADLYVTFHASFDFLHLLSFSNTKLPSHHKQGGTL
jgi:hypothetical protein